MSDGSWELQQAIYSALVGGSPPAVSVSVYSSAPQNAAVPYVEIGESDTVDADVQCRGGLEETISLHVWTKFGSQQQAKGIMSDIRSALHAKNLNVAGRSYAYATITGSRLFPDANDSSLHGVLTLRVNHFSLSPEEG